MLVWKEKNKWYNIKTLIFNLRAPSYSPNWVLHNYQSVFHSLTDSTVQILSVGDTILNWTDMAPALCSWYSGLREIDNKQVNN